MKRLLSAMLFLCLLIVIVLSGVLPVSAGAYGSLSEEMFALKISQMKAQYPDGKYWNQYNGIDSEGIAMAGNQICSGYNYASGKSCIAEGYCGIRSDAGCTCNCGRFHGWQCLGFANLMAYKIMGSYAISTGTSSAGLNSAKGWTYSTSVSEYYAGDVVRISDFGHSIFIYKVAGDTITYVDCNATGVPCQIDWDKTISLSTLKSKTSYVAHLSGNTLKGLDSHDVHSYDEYIYYWDEHPHYTCYKCACGAVKENTEEPVYIEDCELCNPLEEFQYEISDGEATITGYNNAFGGDVIIPATLGGYPVTTIGVAAFIGCDSVTGVIISDNITTIGDCAFRCCDNLISVTIGKNANGIDYTTFSECYSLTNISVVAENENYSSDSHGVLFDKNKTTLIAVPGGILNYTVPDSVIEIGEYAFYGCGITDVVIPDNVVKIGQMSFAYCTNLKGLTLGNGIKSVEGNAFYACEKIVDVQYSGTDVQWTEISIGPENDFLVNATIHFKEKCNHTYDNSCDTTCNTCGAKRSITHNYATATCTKAKTCKICGATSGKALGHSYTNACDTTCNRSGCGTKRTITHKYAAATCTKAKTCTVCKKTSGSALGHKYSNACDTTCNTCGAKRTITHAYKTTTTKKATLSKNGSAVKKCTVCGKTTTVTIKYAKTFQLSTTTYTYNGKTKKPTVTVKNFSGTKLKEGTDYTVSYASGRKYVGTYKVTVKMKGNYSGTKTLTFKINPKAASVNKLTAKSKALSVKLNTQTSQATGYQIRYSTSKSFKSYKTATITSYKTSTKTISGLKAKTTYYVRVRTYKTVNGVKYYSGWSSYKYMKTK